MPATNAEIAELFKRFADLLEIEDANPFRARAYRNAARVVAGYSRGMAELLAEGCERAGRVLARNASNCCFGA